MEERRGDVLANARINLSSRRCALGRLLTGALALFGWDDRRAHAGSDGLLTERISVGTDHGNATVPFSRLVFDGDQREETITFSGANTLAARSESIILGGNGPLPLQAPRSPKKNKRRDSNQKREHERSESGKNKRSEHPKRTNKDKNKDKDKSRNRKDHSENRSASTAEEPEVISSDFSTKKTLLWTTLFLSNLTKTNLQKIAAAHFNGFQIDNLHQGHFDDFAIGGVSRLTPAQYERVQTKVSRAAKYARHLGMDHIFLRLNIANFDVYSEEDIDKMVLVTRAQAEFARETGLTGIWLDAEDYWNANIWNQSLDPAKQASGRSETDVKNQYSDFGRRFMQASVSEYPTIEILLAPSLHMSTLYQQYKNLADFYAGMASFSVRNSIVVTTELSYDHVSETELVTIANNEMQYLGSNSSVALGFWPRDESATTISAIAEAVRIGRQYSSKYSWVYDEAGIFLQDAPHSCSWEGWDSAHSCLAKVLQEILPPL